jgi:hypothetical protein
MGKKHEFGFDVHLLPIDFKQAHDAVDGEYLYQIFKKFWILKKLRVFNLVEMNLIDWNCKLKIQGQL